MVETVSDALQLVPFMLLHQKLPEPSHRAGKADEILQRGDRSGYGGCDITFACIEERASQFESAIDELKEVGAVDLRCEVFKPDRDCLFRIEYVGANINDQMR